MPQLPRWSELFIPTLREAPADAEMISHRLLLRSGYMRQIAPGNYAWLFLGQRSIGKIKAVVGQEMGRIGQEIRLPVTHPAESKSKPGNESSHSRETQALRSRSRHELVADLVRNDLRSYKQLPQAWYQIQTQFRADTAGKTSPLNSRQSIMLDAFLFDIDADHQAASCEKHVDVQRRILSRCGLNPLSVETHSVPAGIAETRAWVVPNQAGDISIAICENCGYAADLRKATSRSSPVPDLSPDGSGVPLRIHTPGIKTIDDLARFLNVSPKNNMKTLAYMVMSEDPKTRELKTQALAAFLRGDHQLEEAKLSAAIGGRHFRPMEASEIGEVFGAAAGSLGPLNLPVAKQQADGFGPGVILLVDEALQGRQNLIAGANADDYHLKNVTPARDFQPTSYSDLKAVTEGESCSQCGAPLQIKTAIEIGQISKLNPTYSESFGIGVLDRNGKEVSPLMGWASLDLDRILLSAIEKNHDENGFWLPSRIAPFEVIVTPISVRDEQAMSAALRIAHQLLQEGVDVILDDRDERPGVKFKDADLTGIPFRINVGKKVTEGTVEVVQRSTRQNRDASITAITEYLQAQLRPAA